MERRIFRFLRWNRHRDEEDADEDNDANSDEAGECIIRT